MTARDLSVAYGAHTVLDRIDLDVRRGEIVTLIGPNGSGKTTLVRAMLGLIEPASGRIDRAARLRIGYVPQRVVIDPVLPLTAGRFLAMTGSSPTAIAAALAEVGASAVRERAVQNLSGGEFQRVLLARALLREPDLLVLDEPIQGVDITGQRDLFQLIKRIRDTRGCGILLVSHDLHLVMADTDIVVCLNRHICCTGAPEAVSRDPAYLALFGPQTAAALAVYTHHHDHSHAADGAPIRGDSDGTHEPHDHSTHDHAHDDHGHHDHANRGHAHPRQAHPEHAHPPTRKSSGPRG
ncbi:MAG: ATP-binding cassette domain-containing protein [Alphaproteobacteria bacterium]